MGSGPGEKSRHIQAIEAGYEPQLISANKGPEFQFYGKLLIEVTTQNRGRTKARWTELRLWETPAGAWVMESVGCSDDDGHVDITDAEAFPPIGGLDEIQGGYRGKGREERVMDWLGWSYAAREMASKMGWDLTVRVD